MIGAMVLVVLAIKAVIQSIIKGAQNKPTWKGIIISAFFGVLPLYLIFCFLGLMGEDSGNNTNQPTPPTSKPQLPPMKNTKTN